MLKGKFNMIMSVISLFLTLSLLVVTVFAWYATNHTATAENATGLVGKPVLAEFENTVTAVRTKLDGQTVIETYSVAADGRLYLIKRVTTDSKGAETTEEFDVSKKIVFSIADILPGEYIDITIGYTFSDVDSRSYSVRFDDVTGGSFNVEAYDEVSKSNKEYTHYVMGAFKYKNISLKDSKGTDLMDFSSNDYIWFGSYNPTENDDNNLRITALTHTWEKSQGTIYYTFRIYEDFSQYYRLLSQATKSYDALLSNKYLRIGYISFVA